MYTQPLANISREFRQKNASLEIHRDILSRVIEAEIIPRLMMVHRSTQSHEPPPVKPPSPEQVATFCELLLADDVAAINNYISVFREPGLSVETVFLGLMTESARYLGALWNNDVCNFCEVTLAMWRLQHLLHDMSPAFLREVGTHGGTGKSVLLSTVAGEQHTLGLSMVAEFFRRDGWEVMGEIPASNKDLIEAVATHWLDLVGLSITDSSHVTELAETIAAIRQHSLNPLVGVMVGGWLFIEKPELAASVGADFIARDAREAVAKADERAQRLYEMTASPSRI